MFYNGFLPSVLYSVSNETWENQILYRFLNYIFSKYVELSMSKKKLIQQRY